MSALAVILKKDGNIVCGCDKNYKRCPKILANEKIKVFPEKKLREIKTCDFVVVTSAIKDDNIALSYAKKHNKICKTRGEVLGEIASKYEKVIAVAGSHGKTTTTAMIYHVLSVAGKKPSLHLGGNLIDESTNVVTGDKEYFVTEACEYFDNFLHLHPYIAVVTNLEKEHMDYFKTFTNEKKSFSKFKSQSKHVVESLSYDAKNVRINKKCGVSFDIIKNDKKLLEINLKIGGFYNVKNALFAFEVCKKLGIPNGIIKLGLETFLGTQKRLENKKYLEKNIIVDYAHHPTEIQNVYNFLRKLKKKNILIFQPHTFSRSQEFKDEFVKILTKFDKIYIFKTYPAREKPKDGLSAFELSKLIKNSVYLDKKSQVKKVILSQQNEEVTVVMGAGDLPENLGLY